MAISAAAKAHLAKLAEQRAQAKPEANTKTPTVVKKPAAKKPAAKKKED